MKTYNKHPQWYNQPLRLTKEEEQDPRPVFEDFFECYHLNDVREILWQWFTEVISSTRSISIESHDRSNHVYFYEKIEALIEAAFVLLNSMGPEKDQELVMPENLKADKFEPAINLQENGEVFNKCEHLIEYVDDDPLYVIDKVFKPDRLANFCDEIHDWYDIAILADSGDYDDAEQRCQLYVFHSQLQMLVEALFIIRNQNTKKTDIEEKIHEADKTRLLSQDQIANPLQIVTVFFEKFPRVYIIRELDDWLEAGIYYSGPRPDKASEVEILYTYRNVLCLIKSAERLLTR
jgi:hypothetical protein